MKSQQATRKLCKLLTSPLAGEVLEYLKQLKSDNPKASDNGSRDAHLNFRSKP
jgi:hypothetical protein